LGECEHRGDPEGDTEMTQVDAERFGDGGAVEVAGRSVPTGCYVGGKWLPASDGGQIVVLDPATEAEIARVADATVPDALAAVDAAAAALPGWAATAPRERGEVLRRAFDLMVEREEWLAELIVAENGKSFADALGEVRYAAEFFRWYS